MPSSLHSSPWRAEWITGPNRWDDAGFRTHRKAVCGTGTGRSSGEPMSQGRPPAPLASFPRRLPLKIEFLPFGPPVSGFGPPLPPTPFRLRFALPSASIPQRDQEFGFRPMHLTQVATSGGVRKQGLTTTGSVCWSEVHRPNIYGRYAQLRITPIFIMLRC
jgi:hypothetical protein